MYYEEIYKMDIELNNT